MSFNSLYVHLLVTEIEIAHWKPFFNVIQKFTKQKIYLLSYRTFKFHRRTEKWGKTDENVNQVRKIQLNNNKGITEGSAAFNYTVLENIMEEKAFQLVSEQVSNKLMETREKH